LSKSYLSNQKQYAAMDSEGSIKKIPGRYISGLEETDLEEINTINTVYFKAQSLAQFYFYHTKRSSNK
jgi:hypothetical protein